MDDETRALREIKVEIFGTKSEVFFPGDEVYCCKRACNETADPAFDYDVLWVPERYVTDGPSHFCKGTIIEERINNDVKGAEYKYYKISVGEDKYAYSRIPGIDLIR